MKTWILLRTLAFLCLLLGSTLAANAYDFVVNGIYYNKNGTNATVTYRSNSYNSYSGSVIIPSTVTYNGTTYSVTSIGISAFSACSGLTKVTIPNSVTSICDDAFQNCSGLTNLTIPNSVVSIGSHAFRSCSGLTSVTIGHSVTSIGDGAFSYCDGLASVTIPNSVITIGSSAFEGCKNLKEAVIGDSVTSISKNAFYSCGLSRIKIGKSVTYIGSWAFEHCSDLERVDISSIESWCRIKFQGSLANPLHEAHYLYLNGEKIINLVIPNTITTIKEDAFYGCYINSVIIPNSVNVIEDYAFCECEMETLRLGNAIKTIKQRAFLDCKSLKAIEIPSSVTSIEKYAFKGCGNLVSIEVENGNTMYDSRDNCNAIIKTDDNTIIRGCINTVIPNTVSSLGDYSFDGVVSLTKIILPSSVDWIGQAAFIGCDSLQEIHLLKQDWMVGAADVVFSYMTYNTAVVHIPLDLLYNYIVNSPWNKFRFFAEETGSPVDINLNPSQQIGPTSAILKALYSGTTPVTDTFFKYNNEEYEDPAIITGLEPQKEYRVLCGVETSNGKLITPRTFTTYSLRMTAKAADMITNKDARLMAETNMADIETSCGFEWRRYDAPEEMPSAKVYCPVYGGVMAGTLKNMSENVYYKYRPFYKSSAGNEYYGDWVAFITADAGVEFEPVVYTYNSPAVTQTEATMQGVALRGSEEITEQGFEYWKTGKTNMLTASGDVTRVTARGERMSKTVSGLQAGTRYTFRAYVTAGGETTYGQEVQFVTLASSLDVNLDGEINIADVNSVISLILENGVVTTGDVNDDGEVNIADINVLIDAILGM